MKHLNFSTLWGTSPDNGPTMDRHCIGISPIKSQKFFTILLVLLLGFGNVWGTPSNIIPKLYLSSKNTPSGNTGWSFTNATANNANTDYWKMINNTSVVTSPSFDMSAYTSVTVSVKWKSYGNFNSSKCNATIEISTGSGTWSSLGTTGLTSSGTTTKTFENVENSSTYAQAQVRISTPNADGSVGGGLYSVEIKGEAASTCTTKPTVGANLTSVSASVNSITATVPISNIGGCNITENGLVYSSSVSTPTVGAANCAKVTTTACGATAANKTVTIENLDCGTTYYVRGYAINGAGTQYTTNTTTQATSDCPIYTVTLKDDNSTLPQASYGASVILPSRSGCTGYTFVGWTKSWTSAQSTWTETAPDVIDAGEYTPEGDEDLYPVYTKVEKGSATQSAVLYYEPFTGSANSTAVQSTNVAATADMFANSTATVWSHYTFDAASTTSYAKQLDGDKMSNGIKILRQANNTTVTMMEVKGINIKDASSLSLSLYNRRSTSAATLNVSYKIDKGSYTAVGGTMSYNSSNDKWKLCDGLSISGTGDSLSLKIELVVSGTTNRTMVLDDIKLTGNVPSNVTYYISEPDCCTSLGQINGSVSLGQLDPAEEGKLKAEWTLDAVTGIGSLQMELWKKGATPEQDTKVVNAESVTISTSKQTKTYTGLDNCETYYAKLIATKDAGTYCTDGWTETSGEATTIGYAITLPANGKVMDDQTEMGTVTASATRACAGTEITLTATPTSPYTGGTIIVKKTSDNSDVTSTYFNAGTGKLTMPAFGVTISASFTAPSQPSLSATGAALSENTLAFGNQEIDATSDAKTFTLTGLNLTTNVTWSLTGTSASMFSVSPASPILQANAEASQTMTVTFTPTSTGDKTATLTFNSTGADPIAVTLTGTGKNLYTVTFKRDGQVYDTKQAFDGETVTFPENPSKFDDNYPNFIGWAEAIDGIATSAPTLKSASDAITADVEYHAVFSSTPVATGNYAKITTLGELTDGKYVIVGEDNSTQGLAILKSEVYNQYYVVGTALTLTNDKVASPAAESVLDFEYSTEQTGWTIKYDDEEGGYLALKESNNHTNLKPNQSDAHYFTAAVNNGAWTLTSKTTDSPILYCLYTKNQTSTPEFLGEGDYTSNNIYLYKQEFAQDFVTRAIVKHTISYSSNGLSESEYEGDLPESEKVVDGDGYTISTATLSRDGYNFKGWNSSNTATTAETTLTNVTADVTLYAIWEEIPTYDIEFSVNGEKVDDLKIEDILQGDAISFPDAAAITAASAFPTTDKKFVGWIEASSYASDEAPTFVTSATVGNADKTYYAVFADEVSSNYTKVTSEPEDWSGEYILAYDNTSTEAYVFDGTDKASDYVTAEVSEVNSKSVIASLPTGGATITIAKIPETTNYSIMVNGGTNNGKYLQGSASNGLSFQENAVANKISKGSYGILFENSSSYMRFNTTSGQTRFRYYKSGTYTNSGYEAISLYKHAATYTAYVTTVATLDHIAITTAPKAAYKKGEALNLSGMVVTAYFGTGEGQTSKVVTNYTASPANGATLATSDESVTISYLGEEASQTIHVYELSGIALSGTHKSTYKSGETVDATNLVVTATWGGNAEDKIVEAVTGYTIDLESALTTANTKYTVTYTHEEVAQTADQAIHVYDLSGIAVTTPPTKTTYNAGESFDATDMVVIATWGGNAEDKIVETVTDYTVDPATLSNDTENDALVDVTVSYTSNNVTKTATRQVTVHPLPNLTMTWDVAGSATTSKIYINAQNKYLLVLPENDPGVPAGFGAGYVFKGWTSANTVAKDGSDFEKATAGTEMTQATTFHAVFALKNGEDAPDGYKLVDAAPADGETVIFARKVNDTYYAFTNSAGSSEMTLTNGIVSSSTNSILWDAKKQCNTTTATGLFYFVSGQTTNLIHINSNAFNITNSAQNGDIVFSANGDGSFTAARNNNNSGTLDRWISANGTNAFGVTSTESSAVALYVFKYSAVTVATYSNYRFAPSSVVAPEITLAEGTYYGAQSVTITQSQSKPIYYTLDGTNPTKTSTLYNGAISLNEAGTKTIKAVAYDEATDDYSAFDEATYTIVTEIADPEITPSKAFYGGSMEVEISHELSGTEGFSLQYSYDGVNYVDYTSALTITEDKTVYAKATIGSLEANAHETYTKGRYITYWRVTNANQLRAGQHAIIAQHVSVGEDVKIMDAQSGNNCNAKASTATNNGAIITPAFVAYSITLEDAGDGKFAFKVPGGYLYAASSSSNHLKLQETNDANGKWKIEIGNDMSATITAQGSYTHNILKYNSSNDLFSCYASGQTAVAIYVDEICSDINVSALEDNADVTVGNGATLTIDADDKPLNDITVKDGATVIINETLQANDMTVEAGGVLDVAENKAAEVNNLYIQAEAGASGQVTGAEQVEADGLFMDVTLYTSAEGKIDPDYWYSVAVPFDVDINSGIYRLDGTTATQLHNSTDFDVWYYDTEYRASSQRTGWKRLSGKMEAGKAYLIGFDDGMSNKVRFQAAEGWKTNLFDESGENPALDLVYDSGNSSEHANWNGIANPTMHYMGSNEDVQVFDNDLHTYSEFTKYNYVVGTAFFVKATSNSFAIGEVDAEKPYFAPKRESEKKYEFGVRIYKGDAKRFSNQMYVRASEEASAEFDANRDITTMNSATAPSALLWTENYGGKRLAIEDAPIVDNKAVYDLKLYAPANGQYRIEATDSYNNADLYLTYEGSIIWNLSMGAYEIELTKGTTNGYGLLLQAKAPGAATGVDNIDASEAAQKVIINDHVYILRNGQMYGVDGKAVK